MRFWHAVLSVAALTLGSAADLPLVAQEPDTAGPPRERAADE